MQIKIKGWHNTKYLIVIFSAFAVYIKKYWRNYYEEIFVVVR